MALRESIRDHTVTILLINEFKKHFFTTIREDKGIRKIKELQKRKFSNRIRIVV